MIEITGVSFSLKEALAVLRPLGLFVIGMVIYALFIFKLYRFVAKRDIFELNLKKYSRSKHAGPQKFFAAILYVIEHIFLFPILSFFWFLAFTVLLTFLAKEQTVQNILLVSIAIVGTVRITSYYSEDLSRDLAKMLPFALLGVFLIDISFFSLDASIAMLENLPSVWQIMLYYLVFIVLLEFVLRITHGIVTLFIKEEDEEK